ncbi:DUF3488 and transglutaminase-like domain-containing protein [Halioxenophilus sp. WMMB6]|uniref:transglutaminase TgpA family protein n=1 Tax=Halioxenophilus sp. WMMB6 TaxID=3073815 RepID=UPI00295E9A7C|nr:DUF3488 and transglutaminase-like domain-containing protein [Halioxenophilus sp. WMMB6]
MSPALALPRASLAWMLLALVAVIVPHCRHLPIWEIAAIIGILIWRVQLHRGLWYTPGRWIKLLLALISVVGLRWQYGTLLGLEPMVGLLILSKMLKLLEMHRFRDAMTVVLLGFFTTATQFLFSQTIVDFIYSLLCFVLLVATLISLNQGQNSRPIPTLPLAIKLTLQCIPVMVVLFLVFPRLGSLWSVPLPQNAATTGVSGSMSPGDISKLTQDGGRAFTVSFRGAVPSNRDLYWRGIVMSYFDGRTWSPSRWGSYPEGTLVEWVDGSSRQPHQSWRQQGEALSAPIEYEIILEPTHQPWLFALPLAEVDESGTGVTRDFTLVKEGVVSQRLKYEVRSSLNYTLDREELSSWAESSNLQLPVDVNPTTRKTAQEWAQSSVDSEALIQRFLTMVSSDFTYTLEPPPLGVNSVDDFLWRTKQGFCEHYASAFVFFMRAAGVPARVVAGYQGGEWIENFMQVSQSDAHAWAEVWLPEKGWTRVDPTAAVAPERVESGIQAVFARSVSNPLSIEAYRHINLMNRLRLQLDIWNYNWQRWVLNYDQEQQLGLLSSLLGVITWWNAGLLLVGSVALILGLVTLYIWLANRPTRLPTEMRLFVKFCQKCRRQGLVRRQGESARSFIERLQQRYPKQHAALQEILDLFELAAYAEDKAALKLLRRAVTRFALVGKGVKT